MSLVLSLCNGGVAATERAGRSSSFLITGSNKLMHATTGTPTPSGGYIDSSL